MTRRQPCAIWFLIVSIGALAGSVVPAGAQTLTLSTGAGIVVAGADPTWSGSAGAVNGLGIGTPSPGVSVITAGVPGGVLYTTPINIVLSGISTGLGNQSEVWAYVSQNFSNSAVQFRYCYPASNCTTYANYSAISSVAMQTLIVPGPANAGTYPVSLGLFVSSTNGAGVVAGATNGTITFQTIRSSNQNLRDTDTFTLNTTVQTAIRLLLATAGGLTISPASDFSTSFGNVNGLGIGPPAGVTTSPVSGGALYSTPYALKPSFSGFATTTANVTAYVSLDFVHPAILEVRHSNDNLAFSAFSKVALTPTVVGSAVANGSTLTKYLGLFVSSLNGPSAFTGTDRVVLTFTIINQ